MNLYSVNWLRRWSKTKVTVINFVDLSCKCFAIGVF